MKSFNMIMQEIVDMKKADYKPSLVDVERIEGEILGSDLSIDAKAKLFTANMGLYISRGLKYDAKVLLQDRTSQKKRAFTKNYAKIPLNTYINEIEGLIVAKDFTWENIDNVTKRSFVAALDYVRSPENKRDLQYVVSTFKTATSSEYLREKKSASSGEMSN